MVSGMLSDRFGRRGVSCFTFPNWSLKIATVMSFAKLLSSSDLFFAGYGILGTSLPCRKSCNCICEGLTSYLFQL